jgi:hypothetical protein
MSTADREGQEFVYLLGGTPLQEYLDFMKREPVNRDELDPEDLRPVWEAADAVRRELQRDEPDWADYPPLAPIPPEFADLVARVKADPFFQRAFSVLPHALAVVEIDRLVVRQKTVNRVQVGRLKERLGPSPDPEAVFRTCLPFEHPFIEPRWQVLPDGTYDFYSPSNDLRFMEPVVLGPEQVHGHQPFGRVGGVVALLVGYGSNYLNAIASEGRLVLHNGSHRAYALRELGLTHVPCVIQHARTREEVLHVAMGGLRRYPEVYLEQPRPPVLKDYFDARLCQLVRLPFVLRHVQVRYTVDQFDRAEPWDEGETEAAP